MISGIVRSIFRKYGKYVYTYVVSRILLSLSRDLLIWSFVINSLFKNVWNSSHVDVAVLFFINVYRHIAAVSNKMEVPNVFRLAPFNRFVGLDSLVSEIYWSILYIQVLTVRKSRFPSKTSGLFFQILNELFPWVLWIWCIAMLLVHQLLCPNTVYSAVVYFDALLTVG